MKPFHVSFAVPNLSEARAFYTDVLGCSVGRESEVWLDMLFFGHQITIHQASAHKKAVAHDHFGPILDHPDWLSVLERCQTMGAEFAMAPLLSNADEAGESGKFMVVDPAGNILEFKYYRDFEATLAGV